jgi:hypothetical protein
MRRDHLLSKDGRTMSSIPTLHGLMSPAQTLLMLIIICGIGLLVSIMLLISKLMTRKVTAVAEMSDAELDRRRRLLEIERMELEIRERKQQMTA